MELTFLCILSLIFVHLIASDFNIILKLIYSGCVGYLMIMLSVALSMKEERYDHNFKLEESSDEDSD